MKFIIIATTVTAQICGSAIADQTLAECLRNFITTPSGQVGPADVQNACYSLTPGSTQYYKCTCQLATKATYCYKSFCPGPLLANSGVGLAVQQDCPTYSSMIAVKPTQAPAVPTTDAPAPSATAGSNNQVIGSANNGTNANAGAYPTIQSSAMHSSASVILLAILAFALN
ncbi:hypothetical protein HK103_006746 [Boothiomyces macroporosus]|uniref:Uncharacterized protein n=1 Tax=Boothiomyces macroporosus TaxID=261099 RepID=A0AAD5UE22_9FUNG|nr:hypothetical protein HK103_006746 [Boothiomyces macroporosus]